MKIVRKGKNIAQQNINITCRRCECYFNIVKSDLKVKPPIIDFGIPIMSYYVDCPVCGESISCQESDFRDRFDVLDYSIEKL